MPDEAVTRLCEELDTSGDWMTFAQHLSGEGQVTLRTQLERTSIRALTLIILYFSRRQKCGDSDEDALESLKTIFRKMGNGRAIQIVEQLSQAEPMSH